MSIYRKSDKHGKTRYYVLIDLPAWSDGRRRRQSLGGYPTRREAERVEREAQRRIERGEFVEPTKLTFGRYLEQWAADLDATDLRPKTTAGYRYDVGYVLAHEIATMPLQRLTHRHLSQFYSDLHRAGRSGRPVAPRTVAHVAGTIRKALNDLVAEGDVITRNPATGARLPKPVSRKLRTWSAAELRRFLEHIAGDRLAAAWIFAASTGVRRGELAGLAWADLDLDGSPPTATIRTTIVAVNYAPVESTPKTARGRRQIALDPATVAALRAHRTAQLAERLRCSEAWVDSGRVFVAENGAALHPERLYVLFRRHAAAAGLPPIRLHDLRHTHASLGLEAGVPLKVMSERLGHANTTITADTYTHVAPALDFEAARIIAARVYGEGR
jgi:integrase